MIIWKDLYTLSLYNVASGTQILKSAVAFPNTIQPINLGFIEVIT